MHDESTQLHAHAASLPRKSSSLRYTMRQPDLAADGLVASLTSQPPSCDVHTAPESSSRRVRTCCGVERAEMLSTSELRRKPKRKQGGKAGACVVGTLARIDTLQWNLATVAGTTRRV